MSLAKQIVGLDIGSRNVRAVWIQMRDRNPNIVRVEQLALPLDVQDPEKIIRAWIAKCGLTNEFCAVALSGTNTIFQPGRIPHNDPRTPRQIAAIDIAAFNDMAGDTMTYDVAAFASVNEPGLRHSIIAMARPVAIDRMLQLTAQINVRPSDLIPAPVAIFNQLHRFASNTEGRPAIYIDIGHQQTEIAIGTANGVLFARAVPIGGKAFTDAIVQSLGLTPIQAEVRKHADGMQSGESETALKAVAERLLSQISSCLSVYRGTFSNSAFAPSEIILSGGGARLKGLQELIEARLRLPSRLSSMLPDLNATLKKLEGNFDLAVGLAITAMESSTTYLSLLPSKLRDEIVFREKKPYWIAAAICGALALGVFTASGLYTLRHDAAVLQEERTELLKREKIDKRINDIRKNSSQKLAAAKPVADLLKNSIQAREVLTWVCNTVGTNEWLTLFCDEASYIPQETPRTEADKNMPRSLFSMFGAPKPTDPKNARQETAKAKPLTAFIVEGYTTDPSLVSVKEMISNLRSAERMASVDLLGDERVLAPIGLETELSNTNTPVFRRFVIRMEVKPL